MKVTKKLVMFLLVLGTICLVTQGAWGVEVLYAPFEDYYLVGSNVAPHTTVYVADSSQQCVLGPWACLFSPTNPTTNGQQPPVLGKVGKAFEFDGLRYITVFNSAQLSFGTKDFAITFWVKTTSAKSHNNIIDTRLAGGANGYAVCIYKGRPLLHLKSTLASTFTNYYGNTTTPAVNDGKWHYVAIYVDRDKTDGGKIYIDEVCAHTFTATAHASAITNTTTLFIGKHADSTTAYFEGTLDEVRIFRAQ